MNEHLGWDFYLSQLKKDTHGNGLLAKTRYFTSKHLLKTLYFSLFKWEHTNFFKNCWLNFYAIIFTHDKVLNMARISICKHYTEFWISQNMLWQCSEYMPGSKYARILTMAGFWISKRNTGFKLHHNVGGYVWTGHEYAWICLDLQ